MFITSVVAIPFFPLVFLLFNFSISHWCSINKNGTRILLYPFTFKSSSLFNLLNWKFSHTRAHCISIHNSIIRNMRVWNFSEKCLNSIATIVFVCLHTLCIAFYWRWILFPESENTPSNNHSIKRVWVCVVHH